MVSILFVRSYVGFTTSPIGLRLHIKSFIWIWCLTAALVVHSLYQQRWQRYNYRQKHTQYIVHICIEKKFSLFYFVLRNESSACYSLSAIVVAVFSLLCFFSLSLSLYECRCFWYISSRIFKFAAKPTLVP